MPEREARVLYHLRRGVAELGMAQVLTDDRGMVRKLEQVLSDLADLEYALEQGTSEPEPPEFPVYVGWDGQEHGEY